ncbi:MAG: 3'(2'),5'-bisphosphate nucleotidase CysQ [Desulfobacterales bacterium]|jgi:3'(2'), 5'-bisphosphate nucleotidase|nr:3'(2'),5'-bisphosphate nucleotidase CysQ [Desulfobacterales bacterium]
MEHLLLRALIAAIRAGKATLEVYRTDFSVAHKSDDSPLTLADQRSHEIITDLLSPLRIPILSEEGRNIPFEERKTWEKFWLIDPLDGTKEFVKKNDEFTVNIALIENQVPVMGIICVPVLGITYFAETDIGAFMLEDPVMTERIAFADMGHNGIRLMDVLAASARLPLPQSTTAPYTIVGSRSHSTPELEAFVDKKRREYDQVTFIPAGSSLKFCRIAEGRAAIYPRLGPTMEWDTAAGQAIAACAGARVVRHDTGTPLVYNKENLLNPWFIVER